MLHTSEGLLSSCQCNPGSRCAAHTLCCQAHLQPHEFEKKKTCKSFNLSLCSTSGVIYLLEQLQVCEFPGRCDCEQHNATTIIIATPVVFPPANDFWVKAEKRKCCDVNERPPGPTCLLQVFSLRPLPLYAAGWGDGPHYCTEYREGQELTILSHGVQWQFPLSFVYSGTLFDFNRSSSFSKTRKCTMWISSR